jgi:hypothetical protein
MLTSSHPALVAGMGVRGTGRKGGRNPCPLVSISHPLAVSPDAFTESPFEIWHRQRILIVSDSALFGSQPLSRHVGYTRNPNAELDKTCLEQMRDWLISLWPAQPKNSDW